ncbi:MAG: right-handed parallel beta-helix repeat-containing protein [Candidatus Thermoplasmatota archaeon]|nr:right-handed parallel beta-helix repeat-containing protein [Candidatus Thermoplasmatota archaeon]
MIAKKRLKLIAMLLITILLFLIIALTYNIITELNENIFTKKNNLTFGTYYVSTMGSDTTGDGSITNPWRTIQKAASLASAGENVFIREGIYNEKVSITGLAGNGSWITFQPYNNEQVIIDGNGVTGPYDGVILLLDGCNFIRITGLEIKNAGYAGVMLEGAEITDIQVDNCYIHHCQGSGFYASTEDFSSGYIQRIEFDHNNVSDVHLGGLAQEAISFRGVQIFNIHHNTLRRYGKEGIDVKTGSSDGTIHHNIIETSFEGNYYNHIGIYIDPYTKTSKNIQVYDNLIYGYGGAGIGIGCEEELGIAENIQIYNNIIHITHFSGYNSFRCIDSFYDSPWINVKIYNNICNNDGEIHVIRIMPSASNINNLVIANNIFTGTAYNNMCFQSMTFTESQVPGRLTLTNNLYYCYGGTAHNQWVNEEDPEGGWGINPVLLDPLYVNKENYDFHLQSISPAIDAGDSMYAPLVDYDGRQRPLGPMYDIGAYEYG